MHIPKTAGSSFRRILEYTNLALGKELCPTPNDQYLDYETFLERRDALVDAYDFIPGHYPFHVFDPLRDRGKIITVLREPLSRCLSHVKHQMSLEVEQDPHVACKDVNEYLRRSKNELFFTSIANLMVKYLSYSGHPNDFHREKDLSIELAIEHCRTIRFGFAESLDAFLRKIILEAFEERSERLEEIFACRPQKRIVVSRDPFSVNDLTPANLDRLRELNRLDLELYSALSSQGLG